MIRNVLVMMKRGVPKALNVIYTNDKPSDIDVSFPESYEHSTEAGEFEAWTAELEGRYLITVERPRR